MDTNRRFCGLLRSEQLSILSGSGINIEDMSTWSDENRKDFMMKNPGYIIDILYQHRIIHDVYSYTVSEPKTITVYEDGKFEKKSGIALGDIWSDRLVIKNNIGDRIEVEVPFNANSLYETFKDSDAKTIVMQHWDLSNYEYVSNLFHGNHTVEEIDMRGCIYPEKEHPMYMPKADFDHMFEGCTNLKRLKLSTPSTGSCSSERGNELSRCFSGCRSLEYLYIEGCDTDIFINRVIEASEKKITLDGVFSYSEYCKYVGGMMLYVDMADIFNGKCRLSYYQENEDVNFVGKVTDKSMDVELSIIESVRDQGRLDEDDYYTAKYYLETCRKEQVIV